MVNNQDALDAIKDIKEAIDKYGSGIKILTQIAGEWDSYGNVIVPEGVSEEKTKAIIKSSASENIVQKIMRWALSEEYELSMKLYTSTELTKDKKIEFRGDIYEITYIDEMILQDTTLIYEILVKK